MSRLDEAGVAAGLPPDAGLGRARAPRSARSYRFGDFREALAFVNRVGELAERAGHHPDIDIRYNDGHAGAQPRTTPADSPPGTSSRRAIDRP